MVNGVATRYIFAGDLRLAKVTSSGVLHLHKDHLTSTAAVSNGAGEKIDSADFIPFGQERNHSGQRVTHYKYTDQELDSETGLYNYKARLYDPHMGSFASPDPYFSPDLVAHQHYSKVLSKKQIPGKVAGEFKPSDYALYFGDSQRLNRYAYARNDPVNKIDPEGENWAYVIPAVITVATIWYVADRLFYGNEIINKKVKEVEMNKIFENPKEVFEKLADYKAAASKVYETDASIISSMDITSMAGVGSPEVAAGQILGSKVGEQLFQKQAEN